MVLPKYNELMKPLLLVISDGEVHAFNEVIATLAQKLNLSDEDLKEKLPSGNQSVFKNRVGWAKTYLKKAGLVDSPVRATIVITDAGKKVVEENPEVIDSKYLEQFSSFVEFYHSENTDSSLSVNLNKDDLTPDDQLESAYKQINATLASDLLNEVLKISPYTFEKLVVDLLSSMGYGAIAYGSHATVASGDDGIDGVIMEDQLGFSLIYIQAKKWSLDKVVSQPDIQSFVGAIAGKQGHGLFVTTSRFSQKAKDYADNHHIILVDGVKLANLMIKHNFCVSTRKTFEIKTIDTDALLEYQDE
ncbi:winged helix-turn-helix domain-containing protein [Gardnerella swidsinskii]|uniref:Restriction endonuclease n=1 Tax=Gardnerella swidsinskii TaxID=2792979 RepID=A0ABM6GIE1_9BIFI|nr:restriction endonuclease [Gardnerella vaginalis]